MNVLKETNQITVNAAELKVSKAEFKGASATHTPSSISYDEKKETATFHFPSNLPLGEGHLSVTFTGELNDKLKGFFFFSICCIVYNFVLIRCFFADFIAANTPTSTRRRRTWL